MAKKRKLSKKEKREIYLIIGAVVFVALIGLGVTFLAGERIEAISGAAIRLDENIPTKSGVLVMLKDYCEPVIGDGTCNEICGIKTCVPVEESCETHLIENSCLCCSVQ